jgi:hypothetical protein
MNANHGILPIPMPTIIDDGRDVGRFSREVRRSIAALRDRKIVFQGSSNPSAKGYPPFAVRSITKGDGDEWLVTIQEGWVIQRTPTLMDHDQVTIYQPHDITFTMPEYDSVALNADPRPEIVMTDGDYLHCKYQPEGGTHEIVVSENENENNFTADDPYHYVTLLQLEIVDDAPKIKLYQQSDIQHYGPITTRTVDICVDGVAMNIDVLTYTPPPPV